MRAELGKLAGLPSVWFGVVFGLFSPTLVVLLNRRSVPDGPDTGFVELMPGLIGAVVLGVVAAGSEYRGRQIATSLLCVPSRWRLLAAKTAALALVVAVLGALTAVLTLAVAGVLSTAVAPRIAGVVVYWVLSSLLAYGATLLIRNGVLPLTFLLLNATVASVSWLLTKVTTAAVYLPDLAGSHLFLREFDTPVRLAPVAGGLVMAAWVAALLAVAAVVFQRRDA